MTQDLGIKYDASSLNKMKKFYLLKVKLATLSPKLSYSHYVELLSLDNLDEINYYIMIAEQQNLSVRQLRERIKNKEYERLDDTTKEKLINNTTPIVITDFIKNPIVIKNNTNKEIISEKVLQKVILEDLDDFLKELGDGIL